MTLEPGRTLLHYRLVEKLGEGGMGEVWLARDVRLERDVAVKILPAGFATNEQFLQRFEREGKTISAHRSPRPWPRRTGPESSIAISSPTTSC